MKTAICFYGLVGGKNNFQKTHKWMNFKNSDDFCEIAHRHYKNHIFLKNNNIDIFVHTWSVDYKEVIESLYNPISSEYQEQKTFDQRPRHFDPKADRKIWGAFSRWYSTKKVIDLKKQHERENKFTYDCVMLTRFDIAFMRDLCFEDYNMENFYAAGQKNKNHVHVTSDKYVADWWFFSNSKNMDDFCNLYEDMSIHGPDSDWSDQHRMARSRINHLGLSKKLAFTHFRDDDNKLVRELASNPQCKNRGNWWNYNKETGLYYPSQELPVNELFPEQRRHLKWRD